MDDRPQMLYRGMNRAALDAAYDNTTAVGIEKRNGYVADWLERSQALCQSWNPQLDIGYGERARQRLDVFSCGRPAAPTLVFIHGGYWQMNNKEPFGFIGESLLPSGFNLILVEYTLAPDARMDAIVAEIRMAIDWSIVHASTYGGDAERIFVAGHSAGGHLTAIMMSDVRVAGGIPISGIFDLEPIRLNYLNEKLSLDEDESLRHSPLGHIPDTAAPAIIAVGGGELPELIRQSADYFAAWRAAGLAAEYLVLGSHDHFSVLETLAQRDGQLFRMLLACAGIDE
ncbi:MAG: alpha/beta hydrolase [Pseudomonadota bacterium]|nr:alpha/beta hydrolase [Pseudomonadota bacterium]